MHTYIHTFIHMQYIYTYYLTYIHSFIHTNTYLYILTYIRTYITVGVASMNAILGVLRLKEIINASSLISTPIIEVQHTYIHVNAYS